MQRLIYIYSWCPLQLQHLINLPTACCNSSSFLRKRAELELTSQQRRVHYWMSKIAFIFSRYKITPLSSLLQLIYLNILDLSRITITFLRYHYYSSNSVNFNIFEYTMSAYHSCTFNQ